MTTQTNSLNQSAFSSLDQIYKVSEEVLFRTVENEGILLHISTGTYYSLNETSILFWQALSRQQSLKPIVNKITEEYDIDHSQIVKDLQNFIQDLSNCGLISQITE